MNEQALPSGLPKSQNWLEKCWSPLTLTLLTTFVATLLLPRETPFPYTYQNGSLWTYPILKAPFDFEVLHPVEKVREQLAEVQKAHGRYYLMDAAVAVAQKRRFAQIFAEQVRVSQNDTQYDDLRANSGAYLAYANKLLEKLYGQGVSVAEDNFATEDPTAPVYIANGNEEKRTTAENLLTLESARNFLTDSLPYSPLHQPEFLLPLLEKCIAANLRFSDSLSLAARRRKLAEVMSTGITVRRGEIIVASKEIVSAETVLKLNSLKSRYGEPKGPLPLLGLGLATFLLLGGLFFWLWKTRPSVWNHRKKTLLLMVLLLLPILMVSLGNRLGAAVPILIPVFALPVLLWRIYDRDLGLIAGGILLLLLAFSLDWGNGWLLIQVSGAIVALLLYNRTTSLQGRFFASVLTAVAMVLAWLAALFAGRLSEGVLTGDVAFFISLSTFISLAVFPLSTFLRAFLEETPAPSDLPAVPFAE